MNPIQSLFQHSWQLFHITDEGASSLAIENSLIRYLPHLHKSRPSVDDTVILHWYPISKPTILLGAKDTRLPKIRQGVTFLQQQGYDIVVRPHGGMAIVCDPGVINMSIVQDMSHHSISIDKAYQQFIVFLQSIFEAYQLKIDAYEMARSYCPGKFDIIINGQKIGGTAQRRFKTGVTTAAYLSINGNQVQRAQLLKDFYQIAGADTSYPNIDIHCMTTLSDHVQPSISSQEFYRIIIKTLEKKTSFSIVTDIPQRLDAEYQTMLTQIHDRTHAVR